MNASAWQVLQLRKLLLSKLLPLMKMTQVFGVKSLALITAWRQTGMGVHLLE